MTQVLGARFSEALAYAHEAHAEQRRKGTAIPYVAHLLAVAAMVIEDATQAGGDVEDEAIAALLHDAAEDQGGQERLDEIRARFGARVADIVAACSDTFESPKPPWRVRKQAYIDHLSGEADAGVLRVSLADKVHNARAVLDDHRELGDGLWSRFDPFADTLWYYRRLHAIFAARLPGRRADELGRIVDELEADIAAIDRPIPDSYWPRRGRLLAGEYPGARTPDRARRKVEALLRAGVDVFIDLTDDADGLETYAPFLGDGVQHRPHPIRDLDVPSAEALTATLDEIDEHLRAGRVVYVHCWGGIGRTGTVVGCHLVRHGATGEEALAEIARLREGTPDGARVAPETDAQRALVLGWPEKP